jgi:hypothetical protein
MAKITKQLYLTIMLTPKRVIYLSSAILTLIVIAMVLLPLSTLALTQNQIAAQGYAAGSNLQSGMIVEVDNTNPNKVDALDLTNISKMLGVVISANQTAVTISQTSNSQEVYVSNYGVHNVLVSNQNGSIVAGEYISISDLSGIGMKANDSESLVLGLAAGSFDGVHQVLSTAPLTNKSGQKETVAIGSIPVDINIAANPLAEGTKGVPAFLGKIVKFTTNKSVSATRVYLAMLCVVVGVIVTITIIYSGIKNGLISIGRNPLAKKSIVHNLLKVIIVSVIIFGLSLGAAYFIVINR